MGARNVSINTSTIAWKAVYKEKKHLAKTKYKLWLQSGKVCLVMYIMICRGSEGIQKGNSLGKEIKKS